MADNAADRLSVYPNPTTDRVSVTSDDTVELYEIYNITGALVRRQTIGNDTFDIDVRDLPAGAYLLKVCTNKAVQTKRFVKE